MKKYSDDYSDINDREIPDCCDSNDKTFGIMANSDGRRVNEQNSEKRKNVRVY